MDWSNPYNPSGVCQKCGLGSRDPLCEICDEAPVWQKEDAMTLDRYQACLNLIGKADWHLQCARRDAESPQICAAVLDAFTLATLALSALVHELSQQAERNFPFDAYVDAIGDPGANLSQQHYSQKEEMDYFYWDIAG
jgi:hypothetical protein